MKTSKSLCLTVIVGLLTGNQAVLAAPDRNLDAGAGIQLERDLRDMERERVLEQIAEDEAAKDKKVEQTEKNPAVEGETEISFELKQVDCTPSEILTQEEIKSVTEKYIGRQITVKDLQEMTGKITDLYRQKGYMTCGAVLPPQRIHEGKVEIRLIEGTSIPKPAISQAGWG